MTLTRRVHAAFSRWVADIRVIDSREFVQRVGYRVEEFTPEEWDDLTRIECSAEGRLVGDNMEVVLAVVVGSEIVESNVIDVVRRVRLLSRAGFGNVVGCLYGRKISAAATTAAREQGVLVALKEE